MKEILFKKPELKDRELMQSYFAKAPGRGCERTFTNVFLWARFYKVEFAVVADALVFRTELPEVPVFSMPVGEPEHVKKAFEELLAYYQEHGQEPKFYNVCQEDFEQIESWFPGQFQVEYDRDSADYIYETEKLAYLTGKKLHSKRNHINKFKRLYPEWSYEKLTDKNVEECFQMALKWRRQNGCDDDEEKNDEMCVCLNSLRLYKDLHLSGGILRVNGEVAAFSIGEPINPEIFNVHIEKALAESVEGAYPMINQQFVLHECMDYKYVNREEDVGEEGLRKAKLSYKPAFLVEKGILTRSK